MKHMLGECMVHLRMEDSTMKRENKKYNLKKAGHENKSMDTTQTHSHAYYVMIHEQRHWEMSLLHDFCTL
ncbi:hypothetical protein EUGRSUZ_H00816 [Eucalyptus grandis]|uniref:Uncharacterized protein n=2 Tax=Eucalyptus grandis TaxID=71139 RepID=A0ACC3JMI8_EUCGR|nr:hypothetical protein EUGRSUZ_H00816 [Eucalyptus grandis]